MRINIENPYSLAKLITVCGNKKGARFNAAYRKIASDLPTTKRFSYSNDFLEAVKNTGAIEIEEMLGQLHKSSFPFDRFWIEGPSFLHPAEHCLSDPAFVDRMRIGAFVEADQKTNTFNFLLVTNMFKTQAYTDVLNEMAAMGTLIYNPLTGFENDELPICYYSTPVSVSPEGIDLKDDALLDLLLLTDDEINNLNKKFPNSIKGGDPNQDKFIDTIYSVADFLTRFFVLLSSESIPHNLQKAAKEQTVDLPGINKNRAKKGKAPLMSVTPITIDISKAAQQVFLSNNQKKIRTLLGWTTVCRSKPITSKYGRVFTRKEHDRRIPKDEDRRQAGYEVTAQKPVELVVGHETARARLIPSKKGPNGSEPS